MIYPKKDHFISTNNQLQQLAHEAKESWLFDEDTDPGGYIATGLDIILSGDVGDDEVSNVFQVSHFPKSYDKWDALEDWAKRLT